jgi:YD repeat-containing protein
VVDLLLQGFTYTYDANGNKTQVVDNAGVANVAYTYDAKDRLIGEVATGSSAASFSYTYDAGDNLIAKGATQYTVNGKSQIVTTAFAPAGGLAAYATYTYDPDGNLTQIQDLDQLTTMAYDVENRLIGHTQAGAVAFYRYDGDGKKRVENTEEGLTTIVWDDADYLAQYLTPAANSAMFVDQQLPTSVTHATAFIATIVYANDGTSSWTTVGGYSLGSQAPSGNTTWGSATEALPATVASGSTVTITLNLTAPAAGIYPFQWRPVQSGTYFGEATDLTYLQVN